MTRRATETVAGWAAASPNRRHQVTGADLTALARTMRHAIGCTEADLRAVENGAVRAMATAHYRNTYDTAGRIVARVEHAARDLWTLGTDRTY